MKRFGQIIGLDPSKYEEYKKYHKSVWPGVLDMIKKCNIHNYTIFHKDGLLFAYFEYAGEDYEADMAKMAADPETQKWWSIMDPMQKPLENREKGDWWTKMEEVFHTD